MTHFEMIKDTFAKLGVQFSLDDGEFSVAATKEIIDGRRHYKNATACHIASLGPGVGYDGFDADFYFDKDGNFISHAVNSDLGLIVESDE